MTSLFIVNDFPPILGGQANYYFNLCNAFVDEDLIILAPLCPGSQAFDQTHTLNIIRRDYLVPVPGLEKVCKIVLPLVHSISLILRQDIGCIHCGHVLSTGVVGLILNKLLNKPYIVYTHSADILEHQKYWPIKKLLQSILNNASKVCCNSKFTHDRLLELGVSNDKIKLIYPKTDFVKFDRPMDTASLIERYGLKNKKVILSINRLIERKGNDMMIRALPAILKEVLEAVYIIGGSGGYEPKLRALAKECQVADKVIFVNNLSDQDVIKFYQTCDVFTMPSRTLREEDTEGFGVVFLEANACGKPVIGGRSGGIPEAVADGYSGLLVDPLDVHDIAQAVVRLCKDEKYAAQLGKQGKKRVAEEFDRRLYVKDVDDLMNGAWANTAVKKRVLHVITRLDPGGSSTNTIETVARLDRRHFDVFLISGLTVDQRGVEAHLKKKNIRYAFFPDLVRNINPVKDIKAFFQLYAFMRDRNFDIVHTHSSKAGIVGRWAAKWAGVPTVIHTPHGHVFYGYFSKPITAIFIWIEQVTAPITDQIITLTERGKQEHVQFKIGPPEKFTTIYSGIDLNVDVGQAHLKQHVKKEFAIPEGFLFGSVARLDHIKGMSYLMEAMAHVVKAHPDAHLLLVGDGSERENLQRQAQALRIQHHVTFAGFQKDVYRFVELMDVFVLPSLNEGMGRAILEAMACAKPVIATKVGGIPELIEDGKEGFLVNAADAMGLSQAMIKLMEDPELRKNMSKRANFKIGARYNLDRMVKDIEKVYKG